MRTKRSTVLVFEQMRDLAELKSLSAFSLEHELTGKQFSRMSELSKDLFGGIK